MTRKDRTEGIYNRREVLDEAFSMALDELCALPKGFFCTADEALTRAQVEALHPDVILHTAGQQADEQSMLEAAQLAAYYSRARESQNVPVDYTPVRYVKKPAGAKPGMVIYVQYKTVYVDPTTESKAKQQS